MKTNNNQTNYKLPTLTDLARTESGKSANYICWLCHCGICNRNWQQQWFTGNGGGHGLNVLVNRRRPEFSFEHRSVSVKYFEAGRFCWKCSLWKFIMMVTPHSLVCFQCYMAIGLMSFISLPLPPLAIEHRPIVCSLHYWQGTTLVLGQPRGVEAHPPMVLAGVVSCLKGGQDW